MEETTYDEEEGRHKYKRVYTSSYFETSSLTERQKTKVYVSRTFISKARLLFIFRPV